jgi:hypothetical protein
MWILLLIIFGVDGDTSAVVEKYVTQKECEDTRDYVSAEMRKAYAEDTQRFELHCRFYGAKI